MPRSQEELKFDGEIIEGNKEPTVNNEAIEPKEGENSPVIVNGEIRHEDDKNFKIGKNDISGIGKLQDFVESDDAHSIINASVNNNNNNSILPKLSSANMHRLSQFHSTLLTNRQSKMNKTKQSLYLASGLNLNYEEVL